MTRRVNPRMSLRVNLCVNGSHLAAHPCQALPKCQTDDEKDKSRERDQKDF